MSVELSCPRCGGPVRSPDLMHSEWRCVSCGPVPPMHVAPGIGPEVLRAATEQAHRSRVPMPVWCIWPLPPGWTVTGVGWAGDERTGVKATVLACSGPEPLGGGPADMVLVAEEPGVGLGARLAGLTGPDPGPSLSGAAGDPPHAKIRVGGHPTPLWSVSAADDRSAYAGEARGMWLYAISWPASTGYLFADDVALRDLVEWSPRELVYGAPSPYLHGRT